MASSQLPIALIVGLGNPGDTYRNTRHNAGFDFLDMLAEQKGVRFSPQARFFGETARFSTPAGDVWLLKPTTFMNLSGQAVQSLAAYYKITPSEILVVHDELDVPPGVMRLKFGGGNAGHNGLKDITMRLATPDFWRLRVGVGHPRNFCPEMAVYDWVLGRPSEEHRAAITPCLEAAVKCADRLAEGKFDSVERSLKKFANPPKKETPKAAEADKEKTADAAQPQPKAGQN